MHHQSYKHLLRALSQSKAERRGPIALILIQDDLALAETIAHYRAAGVACVIGIGPDAPTTQGLDHSAPFDCHQPGAMTVATNALMARTVGTWILPVWNGERLFWPHGDTRPLPDLFAFLGDERRGVLGGVVLDVYPNAGGHWHVDRTGYDQRDEAIHGGLRDRMGAPCPAAGIRLDRPLAIKARKGLRLGRDGMTNDPELNTRHGPWHHSPTGVLLSPRVWAWHAAQSDHESREHPLCWKGSVPLEGNAVQLWDMGFLEPGQWV